MPGAAKDPTAQKHYVYVFEAAGHPFYVGIGHSSRAKDRLRYVRSQVRRALDGETDFDLGGTSGRLIAELLLFGVPVTHRYVVENVTRPEALRLERETIEWMQNAGVKLINQQHNGGKEVTVRAVLKDLHKRGIIKDQIGQVNA